MGMITLETSKRLADAQAISFGIKDLANADPEAKAAKPLKISIAGLNYVLPKGDISNRYLNLLVQESDRQLAEVNAAARQELSSDEEHDHNRRR